MGGHISQVRSTELDTWQLGWFEVMKKLGNQRANEYWEAKLPKGYEGKPTAAEAEALSYKMKKFITDKYERKLWIPSTDNGKSSKKSKNKSKAVEDSSSSDTDSSSSSSSSEDEAERRRRERAARKKAAKSSSTSSKKGSTSK